MANSPMGTRLRPGQAVVCKRAPVNGIAVHPDEAGAHYTVHAPRFRRIRGSNHSGAALRQGGWGCCKQIEQQEGQNPCESQQAQARMNEWLWIGAKYL